uniref:Sphingomyelin synthase-like domain-containing protein n=1 Tax=Zooxanthella nutricula TaxID=1333877 RepID=A0A6U6Q4T9_9DINO
MGCAPSGMGSLVRLDEVNELGDPTGDHKDVRHLCHKLLGGARFDRVSEPANFEATLKAMDPELLTEVARFVILAEIGNQSKVNTRIKDRMYNVFESPGLAQEVKTPWQMKAYFVITSPLMFFCAFCFQSYMLHIATALYVYYMDNGSASMRANGGQLLDLVGNFVGEYASEKIVRIDGITRGNVKIPTVLLDLSGGLPLLMCVLSNAVCFYFIRRFNIKLWTKTMLVASIMAISKGTWDAMTILPDSTGWENCKARLGVEGLQDMRGTHFIDGDFLLEVLKAIPREIAIAGRVRYCADMMLSGHTYFACLFSLSAFHQVTFCLDHMQEGWGRCKVAIKVATVALCVLCLALEVILVALARFHYTVDMVSSIVLVLLLWDSGHVERIVRKWSACYDHWDLDSLRGSAPILARVLSRGRRSA